MRKVRAMNERSNFFAPLRVAAAASLFALAAGGVAVAQTAPAPVVPVPQAPLPSYATRPAGEQIRGRISAITGKYSLEVRDVRGYIDSVALHQGTIINPTGLALRPGMQVTIYGTPAGSVFAANQIDTPYAVAIVQPVYPALYAGWGWGWGPAWGRGPWGPGFRGGVWW